MGKSFVDLHKAEVLTDNTKISYCEQCKNCIYWGNGDAFSNKYDKCNCDMYPNPGNKPTYVINNTGICPYRSDKKNG